MHKWIGPETSPSAAKPLWKRLEPEYTLGHRTTGTYIMILHYEPTSSQRTKRLPWQKKNGYWKKRLPLCRNQLPPLLVIEILEIESPSFKQESTTIATPLGKKNRGRSNTSLLWNPLLFTWKTSIDYDRLCISKCFACIRNLTNKKHSHTLNTVQSRVYIYIYSIYI